MPSDTQPGPIQRLLSYAVQTWLDQMMMEMVEQPELEPDSEWARMADTMVKRRKESVIPMKLYHLHDFLQLVLVSPLVLFSMALHILRRCFNGQR